MIQIPKTWFFLKARGFESDGGIEGGTDKRGHRGPSCDSVDKLYYLPLTELLTGHEISGTTEQIAMKLGTQLPLRV